AVLFLAAVLAVAQGDRGTLTGTVTDPVGAVVPAAKVTARNSQTAALFETVTTETGNYTLALLPLGVYDLTVQAAGFNKITQQGIRIQVAQTARIDIALQLGSTNQSVTVTADAPLLKSEGAE